jgi:hypothetical protein
MPSMPAARCRWRLSRGWQSRRRSVSWPQCIPAILRVSNRWPAVVGDNTSAPPPPRFMTVARVAAELDCHLSVAPAA